MVSIFDTLRALLKDETQLLSHLLNMGSSSPITGGFRSETYSQKLNCEFVLKIADRIELERQKNYIESLPGVFRKLFPDIFLLRPIPDTSRAAAVMERLPGITLHQFLFRPDITAEQKSVVVSEVLGLLTRLHENEIPGSIPGRKLSLIFEKMRARAISPGLMKVADEAEALLRSMALATIEAPTQKRWIHGDAQGGNFIINSNANLPEVRWIDPLGGSGYAVDDYLYDLSRFYHWLDTVAEIFEAKENPCNSEGTAHYHKIKSELLSLIQQQLLRSSIAFRDNAAPVWFYLYCAAHLAGKLNDFKEPVFQRQIELAFCKCMNFATNEGLKLSQNRRHYAVYQHQGD